MAVIAVLGLGSMGMGMALSCLRAGHEVLGFDPRPDAVRALRAAGGVALTAESAPRVEILVSVVLNTAQTETALFGSEGWAGKLAEGGVVISSATIPAADARRYAATAAEQGLFYLDAPISGGATKAVEGRLSIMASGDEEAFAKARPALDAMAETVHALGPEAGTGSAMKSVNQLLAGTHIAAMAEAMTFGVAQGLKPEDILRVISVSAGNSWMFENRAPHVVEGDYTPLSTVAIWPKDLGIVTEAASAMGLDLPVAQRALGQFREAAEAGLAQEDDAAIAKFYAERAGLKLPGE